jgi:hypothetical protein
VGTKLLAFLGIGLLERDAGALAGVDDFVASDLQQPADLDLDLRVPNVLTVEAERTFWDKIIIMHGLRQWFYRRGGLLDDDRIEPLSSALGVLKAGQPEGSPEHYGRGQRGVV